jgi:hypothetical protein
LDRKGGDRDNLVAADQAGTSLSSHPSKPVISLRWCKKVEKSTKHTPADESGFGWWHMSKRHTGPRRWQPRLKVLRDDQATLTLLRIAQRLAHLPAVGSPPNTRRTAFPHAPWIRRFDRTVSWLDQVDQFLVPIRSQLRTPALESGEFMRISRFFAPSGRQNRL